MTAFTSMRAHFRRCAPTAAGFSARIIMIMDTAFAAVSIVVLCLMGLQISLIS